MLLIIWSCIDDLLGLAIITLGFIVFLLYLLLLFSTRLHLNILLLRRNIIFCCFRLHLLRYLWLGLLSYLWLDLLSYLWLNLASLLLRTTCFLRLRLLRCFNWFNFFIGRPTFEFNMAPNSSLAFSMVVRWQGDVIRMLILSNNHFNALLNEAALLFRLLSCRIDRLLNFGSRLRTDQYLLSNIVFQNIDIVFGVFSADLNVLEQETVNT